MTSIDPTRTVPSPLDDAVQSYVKQSSHFYQELATTPLLPSSPTIGGGKGVLYHTPTLTNVTLSTLASTVESLAIRVGRLEAFVSALDSSRRSTETLRGYDRRAHVEGVLQATVAPLAQTLQYHERLLMDVAVALEELNKGYKRLQSEGTAAAAVASRMGGERRAGGSTAVVSSATAPTTTTSATSPTGTTSTGEEESSMTTTATGGAGASPAAQEKDKGKGAEVPASHAAVTHVPDSVELQASIERLTALTKQLAEERRAMSEEQQHQRQRQDETKKAKKEQQAGTAHTQPAPVSTAALPHHDSMSDADTTVTMDQLSGIEPTATTVLFHDVSRRTAMMPATGRGGGAGLGLPDYSTTSFSASASPYRAGYGYGGPTRDGSLLLRDVQRVLIPSSEGTTPSSGGTDSTPAGGGAARGLLFSSSTPTTVSSTPLTDYSSTGGGGDAYRNLLYRLRTTGI